MLLKIVRKGIDLTKQKPHAWNYNNRVNNLTTRYSKINILTRMSAYRFQNSWFPSGICIFNDAGTTHILNEYDRIASNNRMIVPLRIINIISKDEYLNKYK